MSFVAVEDVGLYAKLVQCTDAAYAEQDFLPERNGNRWQGSLRKPDMWSVMEMREIRELLWMAP